MSNSRDITRLAIHEAGHVVGARLCGYPTGKVIVLNDLSLNRTDMLCGDNFGSFYSELLVASCGKVAEVLLGASQSSTAFSTDTTDTVAIMTLLVRISVIGAFELNKRGTVASEFYGYVSNLQDEATGLLEPHLKAVKGISKLLQKHEICDAATIRTSLTGLLPTTVMERKEAEVIFPKWYQDLCDSTCTSLVQLRRKDFSNIWKSHIRSLGAEQQAGVV